MAEQCVHYFEIDSSLKGICKYCEEERQFPWDARQKSVLLKKGRQVERKEEEKVGGRIPSKYKPTEKARIIEESYKDGVPAVCLKYGLPESTLYTWRARQERRKLKEAAAVSKPADELVVLPDDLLLRCNGDTVQIYCQGKLWAVFSIGDSFLEKLTRPMVMALLERYLKHGTLILPPRNS